MRGVGWKPFFCGTLSRYKTIEIVLARLCLLQFPFDCCCSWAVADNPTPMKRDELETTWLASVHFFDTRFEYMEPNFGSIPLVWSLLLAPQPDCVTYPSNPPIEFALYSL